MKRNIFKTFALALLLWTTASSLFAEGTIIQKADISRLDKSMTMHQTHQRTFKTKKEFKKYYSTHKHHKTTRKNTLQKRIKTNSHSYYHEQDHHDRYNNREYGYNDYNNLPPYRYRMHTRAYRHFKRGWLLAYKYDRAGFYDRDGFYYGYFNRYGYFFEGVFYRYDRYYRYQDRIRGRGLFDRYYYRPAEAEYYGFCR